MPFDRPSLQTISDRITSDFKSRIDGATTLLKKSVLIVMSRVYAGAIHLVYGYLEYMKLQVFASTADSEYLDLQGSEFGLYRKISGKASGYVVVTGNSGAIISSGAELISDSGYVYNIIDGVTIAGTGTATTGVLAEAGGIAYNLASGTLTFVSPVIGVDTTATLSTGGISGGVDQEVDEDYRQRILTRKRQPPHGGADFDYTNWALEVSGVTRAWTIPEYMGIGTVGVVFVRDDDTPIFPNDIERNTVYDYIIEHTDLSTGKQIGCPVTARPGFFVIDAGPYAMDFDLSIFPNTSAVQQSISSLLDDLILANGAPNGVIYLNEMITVISAASGLIAFRINSPVADLSFQYNQVPVLGTIVFSNY